MIYEHLTIFGIRASLSSALVPSVDPLEIQATIVHNKRRLEEVFMVDGHRLNNMISALEKGQHCFTSFSPPDISNAVAFATAPYDGIVFEMEHNPWDPLVLRDL